MLELLTEGEREFLRPMLEAAIEAQTARIDLEKRELGRLIEMKASVDGRSVLPEPIMKVRSGMVTLDMLNSTKRANR